ncbi:MAG: translocation/assembly module TamB domain-containing protein, partial [Alphaproteobacteria bacterium]|nr:translocation/assembly module TamB domain-containing protein [Alphaproteobacteria bacterium]
GVGYEATSLIDVEAGFGYIRQNFENAAFKPLKAFNFHFVGRWTPKPRWLLTAGAERTVDGSPRSDVPAIFRTTYQLAAQRAMTDRLMLSGAAAYVREDYQAISRVDRRFEGSVSVQYRLTPNVGVLAKAGYRRQDGGLMGRSYEGVTGSLALRLVL